MSNILHKIKLEREKQLSEEKNTFKAVAYKSFEERRHSDNR